MPEIRRVIGIGQWVVNGPVMVLIFGGLILSGLLFQAKGLEPFACAVPFTGWVLAWVWWSTSIPRWRLWAMRRVEDLSAFHQASSSAQLEWPKGHFFEKTEIKPRTYNLYEHELTIRYYIGQLLRQIDGAAGKHEPTDPQLGGSWQIEVPSGKPETKLADLATQCRSLLNLMGVRGLHVGFSPSVEVALENILAILDEVKVYLYDPAWQGSQVQLKRLLSEYLVLLKQS